MPEDQPADIDDVDEIIEQWATERPDLNADAIGVFGRLARIQARQRAILQEVHERHGLTLASFDVLANLRRSGAPHRKTAGDLATSSLLTSGGITFRLDKMEAGGLIRRVRSATDRRVVYAELTDEGLAKIDAVFADHLAAERAMLQDFTDDEVREIGTVFRRLARSVESYSARADVAPE